jgi:hypothetical protein
VGLEAPPMTGHTNRFLLIVIVVLLGYIGVSEWRRRQRPPETDETVGRFALHQVDEVSFTTGTATIRAVREADGRWSLTHPLKDEADGSTILSILSNLKELKIIRSIADPDDLEQYGLTRPRVITLRERGPFGGTRHTYLLGEISPVHYVCPLDYWIYAQRQGEPRVLVVEGYQINHLLPQTPDDLRNRHLLSFNPRDVRRIEVLLGDTAYTAVETPEGWMTQGHHGRSPFTYMQQVLFTLANLRAVRTEVREGFDLAALGLDPPVAQVLLYTDQPAPVEVISFGGPHVEPGVVYVQRESTRSVYLVSRDILEELRQPPLAQERSRAW